MSTVDSGKFIVPAAWMSLIETAIVLVLVPSMERVVYPMCVKYSVFVPRTWRVAFGMILAAASAGMGRYQFVCLFVFCLWFFLLQFCLQYGGAESRKYWDACQPSHWLFNCIGQ